MSTRNTAKTSAAIIVSKLFSRAIDLVVLMILARILTPADFGIVAIARTSLFIIEAITELPIAVALIREDNVTDEMLDTALTLGVMRGFAIAFILIGLAEPIANFYHEPKLYFLTIAISLGPFFRGIQSPKNIIYIKKMDFRREIVQELVGKISASLIGTVYAITYKDYWALAIITITGPAITSITSFILAPMRIKPSISKWHFFKDIIGWNFVGQLMASLNWQLERIVLPRYIDKLAFGQYTSYSEIIAIPIQIFLTPISKQLNVKFKNTDRDTELIHNYLKVLGIIFIFISPIFAYAALFSKPVIFILFGERWLDYSYIFSLLAICGIIYLPTTCIGPIATNLYQNRALTIRTFFEFCINIPLVTLLTYFYGLDGAVAARLITTTFVTFISFDLCNKLLKMRWTCQITPLINPICSLCLSGFLTRIVFSDLSFQQKFPSFALYLICSLFIFFSLYLLTLTLICIVFNRPSAAELAISDLIFLVFGRRNIESKQ